MDMKHSFRAAQCVLLLAGGTFVGAAQAATYYVATNGSDSAPGTLSAPFATLQKAVDLANPGDTIYMRGCTYAAPTQVHIGRNGSSAAYVNLFNYPGEVPVLDGSGNTNASAAVIVLDNVSWWHLKGLEVRNGSGWGIYVRGTTTNDILELCNVHHNLRLGESGGGINVENASNILILNNDTHNNGHIGSEGGSGITIGGSSGSGNVIRGNRIYHNNDNGLALWNAYNVLVENNWSFENGYDDSQGTLIHYPPGDGPGYKLGGSGSSVDGAHIVRNNLAWKNYYHGFDDNSADQPLQVYNNTAWANGATGSGGTNFAFYSAVANVLTNNVAFTPNTVSFNAAVRQSFNSWNLALTVTSADFQSLDNSEVLGPRNADGSLPTISFLKLAAGSQLIDKGTDVGLPYTGSAPDLGAYEYSSLPAPADLRQIVN